MQDGLYVVDFHAHLQDSLMQEALCREDRQSSLFHKHAAPWVEQLAHLGEPIYDEPLRTAALHFNDRLSRNVLETMGHIFLVETLRLFKKYGIERLLASMEKNNIDHVVIHSLEPLTRAQNIAQIIAPYKEKFSLFASVSKDELDPVLYFSDLVKSGAVSGLKIHPQVGEFACGEIYHKSKDLVDYCGSSDLPILIHTGHIPTGNLKGLSGCSEVKALEPLIADFPKSKFILAHIGWESWRSVLEIAKKYPNVCVETSWQPAKIIRRAVDTLGAERVLFGSDFPLFQQSMALKQVKAALTPKELVLVASVNARRLLKLENRVGSVRC